MKTAIIFLAAALVFLGYSILNADANLGGRSLDDFFTHEPHLQPVGYFHVVVHEGAAAKGLERIYR